ncbi:MAG: peptidoglycan DD-metalloendopeptidase family protein [Paramuribaculum sp.]|nr:peptidoglycan DD-metalloendopeptidase family protein [Paramuribaculum sp.]
MNCFRPISRLLILLLAATMAVGNIDASGAKKKQPQRTMKTVRNEQQAERKSIKEATRKLDENTRRTEQNLSRLNLLDGEIRDKQIEIDRLRRSIDTIDGHIRQAADSARWLDGQLILLKKNYSAALRKMQGTYRNTSLLSFLFSSKSFSEAVARYRYLREFSTWRKRKLNEIEQASIMVRDQQQRLGSLNNGRRATLSELSGAESLLKEKRDETGRVVDQLKKEGSALKAAIAKKQQRIKKLDSELDRMIVAEQKRQERLRQEEAKRKQQQQRKEAQARSQKKSSSKTTSSPSEKSSSKAPYKKAEQQPGLAAADRTLSGGFESNKGRLLFPVRGTYTIVRGYGRTTHPDLPDVVTDNPGIDIASTAGAKARSIFEGTVSGVFAQDGFNKVVMIRHGSYISIYANLSSINVKVGDRVKANQDLGVISVDPQQGNRPVLHFELRRERQKLNPLQWVK